MKTTTSTAAHLPTLHDLHLLAACFDPTANELAPAFGAYGITETDHQTMWDCSKQYYPDLSCLPVKTLCDLFDVAYNLDGTYDDVPMANYHQRVFGWLSEALCKVNPDAFAALANNDLYLHPERESARYWFCKAAV